ncbi:MAG: N-acetylglucosamine-6-phosphate deacetylase [Clostridia bacterium]|nr:N-acetylglucosamine-6-phosphate deacetylase [Clostridia bacterium]
MAERVFKYANVLVQGEGFKKADLVVRDGIIRYIGKTALVGEDCTGKYIIPGLVDIHTHGCMGKDHGDGEISATDAIRRSLMAAGTTSLLATVMTDSRENMLNAAANAVKCAKMQGGARILGVYMEGPFFSREYKGAQNPDYLSLPDVEFVSQMQQVCGGGLKIISLAPELEGAADIIRNSGCKVFLGHTGASYEQAAAAFAAGAAGVTHTFNCMPPIHHRSPGVVAAAMDSRAAFCECICDGLHVHPAAVRMLYNAVGKDRFCMVSDSIRAAGLPDGEYVSGGQYITVKDGKACIDAGNIAGSTCTLLEGVRNLVRWNVCSLADAVYAASYVPASVVGAEKQLGSIAENKLADLVVLDKNLNICEVIMS